MSKVNSKETPLAKKPEKVKRLSIKQAGPLYLDDSLKEEGYVLRCVDADRPGRVAYLEKLGYTVVTNSNFQTGDSTVNNGSQLGATATVQLGISSARNGVWMKIPKEIYDEIQEEKEEINKDVDRSMGKTGIPTQFGEIIIK